MLGPDSSFRPITALSEVRTVLDEAPNTLKQDISRIKKLLADPDAVLPVPVVAFTLQEAKVRLIFWGITQSSSGAGTTMRFPTPSASR